jgi:LacI family transcriptional regulator
MVPSRTSRARPRGVVRLADVAREAGVGTSIVSRVLNRDPTVSIRPETRARIEEAARALNYRPNAFARGLKLRRTMTVGVVIPHLAYPVNAEIIKGAERRAALAGYVTLLADADEFLQSGEAYRRLLLEQRVDGLLIASASTSEMLLSELAESGLPFVLANRRVPHLGPSVTVDDAKGTEIAVRHLLELGHRGIAHITGPRDADTARRRATGFRSAMRLARLGVPASYIVEAPYEEEGGLRAMERLLALANPPTAVVVWSLAAAVGALAAAKRLGLSVPADLSLVGFHDAPLAEYLDPPLTTVRMPLGEMAERGVEMLLQMIEGGRVRSQIVQTLPELVLRASTGPPPSP